MQMWIPNDTSNQDHTQGQRYFPPRVIPAEPRDEAVTEKWDQQRDCHTKRAYSSLIVLSLLISRQERVPRITIRSTIGDSLPRLF